MTTFTTTLNQVESMYVGYFGRAGDPAGVNYWVGQLNAKAITLAQLAASFSVQPEATSKYPYLANPNINDPGIFVDQVYLNMFNHVADAAGKAYWVAQLTAAAGNPSAIGAMIQNIIAGAVGTDSTIITNKVDVAQDFTTKAANAGTTWNASAQAQSSAEIATVTDTAASVTAAKAATDAFIASAPGPQQTFTLGIDTLTASAFNANFNAPLTFNPPTGTLLTSLQSGDSAIDTAPLTGAGLSNGGTFTAVLNNTTGAIPLVTLKGIPTHTVTNTTAAVSGYNGDITGLVTFNNNNSTAGVTIGAGGGLGIDKGGVAGTTTTGATLLSTVNLNNVTAGGTIIIVNTAALAGAADVLGMNFTGTFGATGAPLVVSVKNDTALGATADNAYETLNVNAAAATFVVLSDAGAGILSTTTLNVTGAGATTLFGGASESYSKLTTINASTMTGGLTVTGVIPVTGGPGLLSDNTVLSSFKGGTGADSIDLSSLTAAQLQAMTAGNLDGGTATDTLILSVAGAASTVAVNNSNFEVMGLAGGTMDYSKFGAGINTINLLAAQTGADTFNNLTSGLTFGLGAFHGGFAETFNAAGSGLTDALTVNFTGAAAVGKFTTTGFEVVTTTLTNFAGAVGWGGLAATASVGATMTHNLIDNQTGGALSISGENVGTSGSLVITGAALGSNIIFSTAPVLAALNASAWGTGLAASTAGITYGSFATSAQSFLGSAGADTFLGSTFADTVDGGAGNDLIANMATGAGGVSAADIIATGTGVDQVFLIGDRPTGALPALYGTASTITDMTVGTGAVGTTDWISLSATAVNYLTGGTANGSTGIQAAAQAQGTWEVQGINAATGTVAITNAASELVKFTMGVVAGATLQATFNAAIGTTLLTGATADKAYFFTLYDTTNSKMVLGLVNDHAGSTDKIETGDVVSLVGTVNMTATDYANITNKHFSVV